jgi:hypothetical protein
VITENVIVLVFATGDSVSPGEYTAGVILYRDTGIEV